MSEPGDYWGSDVPISMPEPNPVNDVVIDMGAIGFGLYGLAHNLSDADLAEYMIPTFSPEGAKNG
jgi:hypothetical protein